MEGKTRFRGEGSVRYTLAMLYRTFPKIPDLRVSALGLGAMRLPVLDGDASRVDEAAFLAMVQAASEAGINYIDTAYAYHGGQSEGVVGRALARAGLRDRFLVATKSPVWLVQSEADWDRFLSEQLSRLGTDHIDFYLFHALSAERWQTVLRNRGLKALEKARADGRIRHLGFSFHDSLDAFKTIVDGYEGWEFCQIQYNYLDVDFQAGREGLVYAAARELGVIAMEPLRGGGLAAFPPAVRNIFARWPMPRMPAEWALRFALDSQEVSLVLSGMGSVDQIWENAAVAEAAHANALTRKEQALYDEARAWFRARMPVPCTSCGYCMPCPNGVSIPDVFSLYNTAAAFPSRREDRKWWYGANYRGAGNGGDACVSCGECLAKCPQRIAIPDRLQEAHKYLTDPR